MPPPVSVPFFIIAGATACGKSELAVQVAERCGGEIVGADAFQIYSGIGILTAQPALELRARVAHHLIGEVALDQRFDVAQYAERAHRCLAELHARGRIAIVCGGTGLYLRALLRGLAELPAADATLRAELELRPAAELARQLAELDPVSAARIDLHNPRRVLRALEVCLLTGRPFSSFRQPAPEFAAPRGVFLLRDRAELHRRIHARTAAMFTAGVEAEVTGLGAVGETAALAIGLREVRQLLVGKITRPECLERIATATRQYAKRQETWFRRESALPPVVIDDAQLDELAAKLAHDAVAAAASLPT